MQNTALSLSTGWLSSFPLVVLTQSGCQADDPATHVVTGKLEVALEASSPPPPSQPAAAPQLVIRTTGWKLGELLVGRCKGKCDDAEIDTWLNSRPDALYGLGYLCPAVETCVSDPKAWGFQETVRFAHGSSRFVFERQPIIDAKCAALE